MTCSELVERAERRLQEAKDLMQVATHELDTEQKLLSDLIRSLRSSRASCKPDVARKFLDLFPAQRCVVI
jgi:DNA polymerase III psi subunit